MRNSLGKRQIRVKQRLPRPVSSSFQMTREEAIQTIVRQPDDRQSLQLIDLFQIAAEELTEAGVNYETLKTLQRKCLSLH